MNEEQIRAEIDRIQQISMVPTMLEVVCRVTGMGFAAIARVTDSKWIAYSVRDEIAFGLPAGGELTLETTICNEIRQHQRAVVIDHVAEDEHFKVHQTPLMYGFQSYISVPIFLKGGEFFGTLCAIDPRPAKLNNPTVLGLFNLFVELISFHLQSIDLVDRSRAALQEMNQQLLVSMDENRQYQHISNHNLQEPLRKIRMFSSLLVSSAEQGELERARQLALKVNVNAQRVSMMIKDISEFSALNGPGPAFEAVSLEQVVRDVCEQLAPQLESRRSQVTIGILPVINGSREQLEQLFFHLLSNAVKFARHDAPAIINITAVVPSPQSLRPLANVADAAAYQEILLEDNGIGIDAAQLEKIFDIFSKLDHEQSPDAGFGMGLAYCRKIVRNHGGTIRASAVPDGGTTFSIILPVRQQPVFA